MSIHGASTRERVREREREEERAREALVPMH